MRIAIVANCQARPVAEIAQRLSPEIESCDTLVVQLLSDEARDASYAMLREADAILAQFVTETYHVNHLSTAALKREFGDRVISWPNIFFRGQNPDLAYAATAGPKSLVGPLRDYHLRSIYACWQQRRTCAECLANLRYADPAYWAEVESIAEESLAELVRRESHLDIGISDVIGDQWRRRRLFLTFNHPTLYLLTEMTSRLLARVGLSRSAGLTSGLAEPLGMVVPPVLRREVEGHCDFRPQEASQGAEFQVVDGRPAVGRNCHYGLEELVEKFYEAYDAQLTPSDTVSFSPPPPNAGADAMPPVVEEIPVAKRNGIEKVTSSTAEATMQDADAAYAVRDWFTARQIARSVAERAPQNYWSHFMIGNACERLGDMPGAVEAWRQATLIPTGARIGAICYLLRHQFSQADFSEAKLLAEGLAESETSNQKRWYYGKLLMLESALHIAHGRLAWADSSMQAAFQFSRDVREGEYIWTWVVEALRREDLSCLPYLNYVLRSADARACTVSYDDALKVLPSSTQVLEIGAMDGIRFDRLKPLITRGGWSAILVEPTGDMFEELKRNYAGTPNVRFVRSAISERAGELTMHRIRPDAVGTRGIGAWALGVSSANLDLLKHYEGATYSESVPAITFDDLINLENISNIDVLQIDTEGHDWIIMKQIDLERLPVKVIHVEIFHLDPLDRLRLFSKLERAGYSYSFDGMNVTAVVGS